MRRVIGGERAYSSSRQLARQSPCSAVSMASFTARADTKRSDQQTCGGYDFKFVDTIPSKYTCSICTKTLCDAHLTECCGQHFCASCLSHWLGTQQGRKTCPYCRQEDFQHMVNKERIREVNEFKIHCTNHGEGCGWVGELGGLKSHLDSDKGCGYVEVACTNEGCGEQVCRRDLQTHLCQRCCYRPYVCEHCGDMDTYKTITDHHYSECLEYPLDCPNRCGVTGIRRRAMPDHHSSCPLEPLNCLYKDAGCSDKIAREDMEDHMIANQQKHMLLTFKSLQRLQCLQDDIRKEVDSLEKRIRHNTNTPETIAQSLTRIKSILRVNLDKIGDTLTFRVTDFHQLKKERKMWQSPPFCIGDKVRVQLGVYPSGVGRGQGSHMSASLILTEVVKKDEHMRLEYNVSIAAIGQSRPATHKITLELCTRRQGDNAKRPLKRKRFPCSVCFSFPSPGEVLQSEELFLEKEEANSLLVNDSMTLELKLLKHKHCYDSSDSDSG